VGIESGAGSEEFDLEHLIAISVAAVSDEAIDSVEAENSAWAYLERHRDRVSRAAVAEFLVPVHVARFFTSVVGELNATAVLDPYANTPGLIASIASLPKVDRALGVVVLSDLVGMNDRLRISKLTLEPPSQSGPLETSEGVYEWAVSAPPLGMRSWVGIAGSNTSGGDTTLTEHHGLTQPQVQQMGEFLPIALNLEKVSAGFIIQLPEAFFWSDAGRDWRAWFAERGFFPFGAVSVSKRISRLRIDTVIVGFGREAHPKLWVGRLEATSDIALLARNFVQRAAKGPSEFGTLVELDEYRTWSALLATRRVESWARKRDIPMAELRHIATDIGRFNATADNEPQGLSNCVYFDSRVVRSTRTSPYRPTTERTAHVPNYYVQLDPTVASAEFVSAWFASELGAAALDGCATGTAQRRLSQSSLTDLQVPLPSIDQQEKYLKVQQRIASVAAAAHEALDALGTSPAEPHAVEADFEAAIEQDPLVAWMKRLPYPLAAILEVHLAESDIRERYERLLFFFEALVEFGADLLLSVLRRNDELWASAAPKLAQDVDGRLRNPLRQIEFGGLLHVCFNASKVIRSSTDSIQDPDELRQITGVADKGFISGLTSADLWNACRAASDVRNNFTRAHGGDIALEVIERELERLFRLIEDIRPITFEIFKNVEIVVPGPGEKRGAERVYKNARRLVGPSHVFVSRPLHAQKFVDLEATRLAVVDRGSTIVADALELTGFVRLEEQPRGVKNVAFFYNRAKDNQHVFRCFQTDGQPTGDIFDPILEAVMEAIDP
jgi:hypothetical protein